MDTEKIEATVTLTLVVSEDDVAQLAESLESDKLAMHLTNALLYSCGVKEVLIRKIGLEFGLGAVKDG